MSQHWRDRPSSGKEDHVETGMGKSTSVLQHMQTKIARDKDPSGRASKLCVNRCKNVSKHVKQEAL